MWILILSLVLLAKVNILYAQCRELLGFVIDTLMDDEDDEDSDSNEQSEN